MWWVHLEQNVSQTVSSKGATGEHLGVRPAPLTFSPGFSRFLIVLDYHHTVLDSMWLVSLNMTTLQANCIVRAFAPQPIERVHVVLDLTALGHVAPLHAY